MFEEVLSHPGYQEQDHSPRGNNTVRGVLFSKKTNNNSDITSVSERKKNNL